MLHKGGARKYYKSLFSKQSSFHFRKVLSHLGNSWSPILSYWLWSLNLGNSCSPSMVYGNLLYKEGRSTKLEDNNNHSPHNNHSPSNSTTLKHLISPSFFHPSSTTQFLHPSKAEHEISSLPQLSIITFNLQPSISWHPHPLIVCSCFVR